MRAGSNIGLTSAPRCPQAGHVNFGSRSDSRTSSGHRSALIAIDCAAAIVSAIDQQAAHA
jgi:hypothetical protein